MLRILHAEIRSPCCRGHDASGTGSYTANNLNQYTTAGTVGGFTYDANGNFASGGGVSYTHNGNSRLVGVSGPGSPQRAIAGAGAWRVLGDSFG